MIMQELFEIVTEVRGKKLRGQPLLPLRAKHGYTLVDVEGTALRPSADVCPG